MSAKQENLSAVLYKLDDLRLESTPLPSEPGPNEVLLHSLKVGICGSDVHYWKNGRIGDFIVKDPMILGHETAASVVKVGPGVNHLKVGDVVAIEPGIPCRLCDFCKTGVYNLCSDITFHATPPFHGTLTRYFKHAADFCFKLPDHVSAEEGAVLEPLSVGVHACKRANVQVGHNVLICGAGPIGLVTLLSAKAFGASKICITDINEQRLKMAKQLGASCTILISKDLSVEETAQKVHAELGAHPDITFECSGAEPSLNLAVLATKCGGVVTLVGMGPVKVSVPLVTAGIKELDIRGVFRYRNSYALALSLIADGKIDVKPLITHRFKLEQALDAFETARKGEGIKVMIDCSE
ncbi:Sorbitol dehydrogenase [Halotydeus destructor]|nr:Sorbitol dehydrogenase [Halotydeus destructor]